jgi:tetratricopeptide (TPR) repeat protein
LINYYKMSTEFLEQFVQAQSIYMAGYYDLAYESFSQLLERNPDNYTLLINHAYTCLKLNKFDFVLADAERAIRMDSNKHEGLLLKGIALFHQGKYDEALKEFERAKLILSGLNATDPRRVEVEVWEQKANAQKNNKRWTKYVPPPSEKKKDEKKEPTIQQVQYHPTPGKVTYQWSQTDSNIQIDFKWSLKRKEDLVLNFQPNTIEISFPLDETRKFELKIYLYDEIVAEKSRSSIHLERIELQLEKKNPQRDWPLLEKLDSPNEKVLETINPKPISQPQKIVASNQSGPAYPSSSKIKKDWNKIDKEIGEDMEKNKDEYSEGDPVNKMFQMLYSGSDENTRRAMMKSYQTSGGTVLSMNWDEVKQKDYEGSDKPDAPEGQEWRKWDK